MAPIGRRTQEPEEADASRPAPLPAPQSAPVGSVLALQRQAGNRAVAALLSSAPVRAVARLQTAEDLDRQFHGHLNERPPNWDEAARDLNGFSDADIRERVRDLAPDQLEPVKAASDRVNGGSAHRVRGPILERQWRTAVQRRDWRAAAGHLNGFDDADIDRLLGAMDPDDLMHLDDEVLKTDYPVLSGRAAPVRVVGEPRRLADLDRRYHDAVGRQDWPQAAELLNTYSDADIERLAGEFTSTEDLQQFGRVALVSLRLRVVAGIGAVLARPPHAERVRMAMLESDWEDARRAGDFPKLAHLTCQFSAADVETHLARLHLPELEGLVQQTKGLGALLLRALVEPAERHRARKHLEMTRFALDNSQWVYAVTLLNGLSPADIVTWVDGLTPAQFTAIQPLVSVMYTDANPLFRRVNYRQNPAGSRRCPPRGLQRRDTERRRPVGTGAGRRNGDHAHRRRGRRRLVRPGLPSVAPCPSTTPRPPRQSTAGRSAVRAPPTPPPGRRRCGTLPARGRNWRGMRSTRGSTRPTSQP